MRTFPPNTFIVEVDPLQNADDVEQHGPTFSWRRASSSAPCSPQAPSRTSWVSAGTPFGSSPRSNLFEVRGAREVLKEEHERRSTTLDSLRVRRWTAGMRFAFPIAHRAASAPPGPLR
jgi:hypothetical protein